MLESLKPKGGTRWPRGQRFQLTEVGASAETAHADAVRDARALGRAALDAAQLRWAGPLGLEPSDAAVLSEMKPGRRSISDVSSALDDCGRTKAEVKAAVDRLVSRGLVEPLPAAAPAQV